MHRVVPLNAGGRRLAATAQTLCRFPDSRLAAAAQAFLGQSSGPATPTAAKRGKTAPKKKAAVAVAAALPPGFAVDDTGDVPSLFVDAAPAAVESVLGWLRTGEPLALPTAPGPLRSGLVHALERCGLLDAALPGPRGPSAAVPASSDGVTAALAPVTDGALVAADGGGAGRKGAGAPPEVLMVQLSDHLTHDAGVKRHAMNITYGSDGFRMKALARRIRGDLSRQLAASYWQVYQSHERCCTFMSTRVANASADVLLTSVAQRVIEHTELAGYQLVSSYVTLSPDVQHTSVRLYIHTFLFRRVRAPIIEPSDAAAIVAAHDPGLLGPLADAAQRRNGRAARGDDGDFADDDDGVDPDDAADAADGAAFQRFRVPAVGPQGPPPAAARVPASQRLTGEPIWGA